MLAGCAQQHRLFQYVMKAYLQVKRGFEISVWQRGKAKVYKNNNDPF
jgi:hypothetical protein